MVPFPDPIYLLRVQTKLETLFTDGIYICFSFQGALVGVISSLAVTSWVAIGSILYRSSQQSAVTCQGTNLFNETVTTISPSFTTVDPSHEILGETNDDR